MKYFALLITALVLLAACSSQQTPTQTIKIGVWAPLSGEAASFGKAARAGAMLAAAEINAAGGVNGQMIELIFEDDQCTPQGGSVTASKLVNFEKVDAIVGPVCSGAAGAGLPSVMESRTPIVIFASAPHLTTIGDSIFRNYPSDAFAGVYMAKYSYDTLAAKKAVVVYTKNDWGQGIHDTFTASYEELGGTTLVDEAVESDERDFRTLLVKIKEANPDVIIMPLYPANALAFVRQMREMNIDIPVIGGDALETTDFKQDPAAQGVLLITADIGSTPEFENRVSQYTDDPTNLVVPLAYDAVYIITDAMKRAGTTDKLAVRDELAVTHYEGIASPLVEFDEEGDLKTAEYAVKVIKDGKSEIHR